LAKSLSILEPVVKCRAYRLHQLGYGGAATIH